MKVEFQVNMPDLLAKVERMRVSAVAAATEQALTDITPYVPYDVGTLSQSAQAHSDIPKGRLVWVTPYARVRYYTGKPRKRGLHPKASLRWAHVAKRLYVDDWRKAAEKAMGESK